MKFTDVIDILDRSVGGPDADVSSMARSGVVSPETASSR